MSNCLIFVFGALIEYAIANVMARSTNDDPQTADIMRAAHMSQRIVSEDEDTTAFVDGSRLNGNQRVRVQNSNSNSN